MAERRSSAPDFELGDVTWQCWVKEDGSYEWRSDCGHLVVWREGKVCRARRDGTVSNHEYPDLYDAMRGAQFGRRRAAA